MSFILDALRKSELERQRQSGPSIAELPVARDNRRMPLALLVIGVLLAVNAAVLLYFMTRDGKDATAAAEPAPAIAATQIAAAPVAVAPMPQPATGPAAAATEPGTQPEDTLAAEAGPTMDATAPPPAPDPTLLPDAPVTYATSHVDQSAPSIEELPAQATAGLPELSVDLHIYAEDPAKRAVFINGRRYQRGGVLPEGPTVEEITRDGAVLSYRGQRFLLPRQ